MADHIIMNLPHSASAYFTQAVRQGHIIHYYDILPEKKIPEKLRWLHRQAAQAGKQIMIKNCRKIGAYSPSKIKIAVDMLTR
jgi:tRNA G37 N-methylase Trm5